MDFARCILSIFLVTLLVGCKIDISVPIGGTVVSESGVYECRAGEDCLIDVADTDFDETFVALADPGFRFTGWRRDIGFLCGSSQQSCRLSTRFLADRPQWLSALGSDAVYTLEPRFECESAGVEEPGESCVKTLIRLNGRVSLAFAAIAVSVEETTYKTRADESGNFSLQIAAANPDRLVAVEASGSSATGRHVQLRSMLGPFGRLSPGRVYPVNFLSTANYVLLRGANDLRDPATDRQQRAAESNFDPGELLERAVALKLLADSPQHHLPEEYASAIELIADAAAVDALLDEVNSGDSNLLEELEDSLVSDATRPTFFEGDFPQRFFSFWSYEPGPIAREGSVLEFQSAGQEGSRQNLGFVGQAVNRPFTWRVQDGDLHLDYLDLYISGIGNLTLAPATATPEEREALRAEAEARGEFLVLRSTRYLVSTQITKLTEGTETDVVWIEDARREEFDPVVLSATTGETLQFPDQIQYSGRIELLQAETDLLPLAFSDDCTQVDNRVCPLGNWGGQFRYPPGRWYSGSEISVGSFVESLHFSESDGVRRVEGVISQQSANWDVVDGKLVIDYPDGWTQTITLLQKSGVEYGTYIEYSDGVEHMADYAFFVHADEPPLVGAETFGSQPGYYWFDTLNGTIYSRLAPVSIIDSSFAFALGYLQRTSWELDSASDPSAGYTHDRLVHDHDGDGDLDEGLLRRQLSWALESQRLRIDSQAEPSSEQYWYPLALTRRGGARRLYVVTAKTREGAIWGLPELTVFDEVKQPDDWEFVTSERPPADPPPFPLAP